MANINIVFMGFKKTTSDSCTFDLSSVLKPDGRTWLRNEIACQEIHVSVINHGQDAMRVISFMMWLYLSLVNKNHHFCPASPCYVFELVIELNWHHRFRFELFKLMPCLDAPLPILSRLALDSQGDGV